MADYKDVDLNQYPQILQDFAQYKLDMECSKNTISDYLMDALQEKRRLPIPITLKEVNEIMPKRSDGFNIVFAIHYTVPHTRK